MTRKLRRDSLPRIVVLFITILITLAALAVAQAAPVHFANAVSYNSGGSIPYSVVVADVNGDGKPDLVVANECAAPYCAFGSVGVLLGNGDGTFQPATAFYSGGQSWSLAVADVNLDGKPDIVVLTTCDGCGGYGDTQLSVLLGNGDGTFQAPVSYSSGGGLPIYGGSVAIADVNSDGKPDLVVTNRGGTVGVLLGNGDGTFQAAVNYSAGGSNPVSVVVGDVNGDGRLDLVVANRDSSSVSVLLGNGDGAFQVPVSYSSGGEYPQSVAIGDLNGDGNLDLVVANGCRIGKCLNGEVSVLLGNGDGTFQSPTSFNSVPRYAYSVAIADVNGDGKPDLVIASGCPPYPPYYFDGCSYPGVVSVLPGNGDGTFQAPVNYYPGGWDPLSVSIADVNADSRPDLLVTSICGFDNGTVGAVGVLLNTFAAKTTTTITSSLNPSFVNQLVTFTATVTSTPPVPDGQLVTFYDGTTALASVALVGGTAAYSTSSLSAKTHYIQAKYSGDTWHKPSFGTVGQVVNKYPTTTNLSSSLNPSNYEQAVTLTATVTSAGPAPTGTVTFKNGSVILVGKTLNASGVASFTTAKIPVGANTLTATYNGDASNAKSVSAAITQTVSQASVSMVLTSTPNPSTFGKSVKFTARLTSNGGLPSGQPVTFSYNSATMGTANVNSYGVATFSTTTLPQGSDVVTAEYAGSVDYSSASATVTQVVN